MDRPVELPFRRNAGIIGARLAGLHVATWLSFLGMACALAYADFRHRPALSLDYMSAYYWSHLTAAYGWPLAYRVDHRTISTNPLLPQAPPRTWAGPVYFPGNAVYDSIAAVAMLFITGFVVESLVRCGTTRFQFGLGKLFLFMLVIALCLTLYRSRCALEFALGAPWISDLLWLPLVVRIPLLSGLAAGVYLAVSFGCSVCAACFRSARRAWRGTKDVKTGWSR